MNSDVVGSKSKFQNEIYDVISGLGYEWDRKANLVIIDPNAKSFEAKAAESRISSFVSKLYKNDRQRDLLIKYIGSRLSYSKGGTSKNIFATLLMALFFLHLSYHYLVVEPTIVGFLISLIAFILMVRSFLSSVRDLLSTDKAFLRRKYGFQEESGKMYVRVSRLTTMKKLDLLQGLFFSGIILIVTFSSYLIPSPPLLYFMNQFNPLVLSLTAFVLDMAYLRNRTQKSDISKVRSSFIAAIFANFIFISFLVSYFLGFQLMRTIVFDFFDLMLALLIPYFLRDLILILRYLSWLNDENPHSPQIVDKP